jgi:hypothetical protein
MSPLHNWTKKRGEFRPTLDFAEWDFRDISKYELFAAIHYEYARSCPWVIEAFNKWHEQRITLPRESKTFRKWNNKKVFDVLNHLVAGDVREDVIQALSESTPHYFSQYMLDELSWISRYLFPTPFLELRKQFLLKAKPVQISSRVDPQFVRHLTPPHLIKKPLFSIVEPKPHMFPDLLATYKTLLKRPMLRFYFIGALDLSQGIPKALEDIKKCLYSLPPIHIGKRKTLAKYEVELKELAAYRLSQAGLSYQQATKLMKDRLKSGPRASELNVFPDFSEPRFSEAIKSAKARILQMFPAPPEI